MVRGTTRHAIRATVLAFAAAIGLQATMFVSPALAQEKTSSKLSAVLAEFAKSLEAEQQDEAIRRAFRDELDRDPNTSEMRRYRTRMHEDHWSEEDVRDDLRNRSDYRRHSGGSSANPDQIIRRAYQDILNRDPDQQGLRTYRSKMIDEGWTERDVREALRKSSEHAKQDVASADRIVRRVYQDILEREPDHNGLVMYRNNILHQGWDEHDVREALQKSPEFRQKNAMTREKAEQIVNRAYRSVLNREADREGMQGYVNRVLRDHWSEADVARELRHSDEYRSKHR